METIPTTKIKNVHTRIFAQACDQLGIPYRVALNTHALYVTTKSGTEVLLYKAGTPLNRIPCGMLSRNKRDTTLTLQKAGLPVPYQERIHSVTELEHFYDSYPQMVVKPMDSMGGKGVTVLPKKQELADAYARALTISKKIIAEQYIVGNNYRLLILDDQVLAVALRLPPFIVGDGMTTIETLVADYNMLNHSKGLKRVALNSHTQLIIKNQGYTSSDILPRDKTLYLRLTANLCKGGTVKDVTALCDESYKKIAIQAARAVGLRLAGIDIITSDISKPTSDFAIIETNANPGMRIHYKDPDGAKLEVAVPILKAIAQL